MQKNIKRGLCGGILIATFLIPFYAYKSNEPLNTALVLIAACVVALLAFVFVGRLMTKGNIQRLTQDIETTGP